MFVCVYISYQNFTKIHAVFLKEGFNTFWIRSNPVPIHKRVSMCLQCRHGCGDSFWFPCNLGSNWSLERVQVHILSDPWCSSLGLIWIWTINLLFYIFSFHLLSTSFLEVSRKVCCLRAHEKFQKNIQLYIDKSTGHTYA